MGSHIAFLRVIVEVKNAFMWMFMTYNGNTIQSILFTPAIVGMGGYDNEAKII